ncbi:MAG: hypothetical protein A2138_06225 [Deltaproteobacteria bacterium RBG_16_71_12]|nr:MAG: hypothetical protein A2138_06225 [Deltaproteobacteria bacterium RBG_16_71_12]
MGHAVNRLLVRSAPVIVVVALCSSLAGCPRKPEPPPPRPKANVAGVTVLLEAVPGAKVSAAGCPDAVIASLPERLSQAASGALAAAGFQVVSAADAAHLLTARVDSDVSYCNGQVGVASGSAGLSLIKGDAVIHRAAGNGELSTPAAAGSLMTDLIDDLVHDAEVIRTVDQVRGGK